MIQPTETDTVIDEIHQTRRQISEKFGGDVAAILEDARARQAAAGRPVWKGKPPKKVVQPSDDDGDSESRESTSTAE